MASAGIFTDPRLFALSMGNFVVGTSLFIVGGLLNDLASAFNVSIARAGFLIAAFAITSVIAAPLFATLSSRLDRRPLLAGVLLICALANGLAVIAQTYEQLLGTRLLAAVTSAVFTPQASAVLGVLVAPERRNQAISAVMIGWGLASVMGLPAGVWIGHELGWRWAFGGIAAGSLLAAAAVWFLLPARLYVAPIGLASWTWVLRSPALLLLLATSCIFAAGNHAVLSYFSPMILSLPQGSHRLLSGLLVAQGVAALASSLLAVLLMNRLGVEKISRLWGLLPAVVLLVWPLAANFVVALFVMQLIWSLGAAGFNGIQQARLIAVAPALAAASIALNSSAFYLGQAGGTLIGGLAWGWIAPRFLPWVGLLLVVAAIVLSRKGRHAARKVRAADIAIPPTP